MSQQQSQQSQQSQKSLTHWKKLHNPDYLGVYSLVPGQDLVATIKQIQNETVIGANGKKEECSVMHFIEANIKPMIVNATNFKMMQKLFKTPYIEQWRNRQIQIYADMNVKFGKETVEGLRIRPFLPKTDDFKCVECGNEIKQAGKMNPAQMADYTNKKYGKALCYDCATKEANKVTADAKDVL